MTITAGGAPRIYLAGPEVFLPDAAAIGAAKAAICAAHGLAGRFPFDSEGTEPASAPAIYARCLAMMAECDAVVVNLTPFRGPSADVGTAFELGFMAASRKPVFGYSNSPADLKDRIPADGLSVEDFGLFDNLMLAEALRAGGLPGVVRPPAAPADPARDLATFERCVAMAAARLL